MEEVMSISNCDRGERILLVEDDPLIAESIVDGLSKRGYGVTYVADGSQGLAEAIGGGYSVLVVDRKLPNLDGLSLVQELRRRNNPLPVLILSGLAGVDDRISGLQAGGDDYLAKPFIFAELDARVAALLRRSTMARQTELRCGSLELDLVGHVLRNHGRTTELLPREFDLLEFLMRRQGEVVTRQALLQNVWHYNFTVETNVVDVYMCKLRQKIETPDNPKFIHNIRGVGFMFMAGGEPN